MAELDSPVFNKKQKRSGFNKLGHYQFGYATCRMCKSDQTHKEGKAYRCEVCIGLTGV